VRFVVRVLAVCVNFVKFLQICKFYSLSICAGLLKWGVGCLFVPLLVNVNCVCAVYLLFTALALVRMHTRTRYFNLSGCRSRSTRRERRRRRVCV